MKRIGLIIAFVALLVSGVALVSYALNVKQPVSDSVSDMSLTQAGDMKIEIAADRDSRERGLSGRANVPDDYGLLFVFETPDRYGFWMKDMLVPIDIVWLSDNAAIVGIEHSVFPATFPSVFYPPQPVRYVLETRAGYAGDKGWEVGTVLPLPIPE
ncbi:MAG TPA: DUF192 domain-containing protein [Candidatus Paceibacterota bacterium]|nr:DUF192 domain-containing protein [Candidatus Paceibacterota bacterium]